MKNKTFYKPDTKPKQGTTPDNRYDAVESGVRQLSMAVRDKTGSPSGGIIPLSEKRKELFEIILNQRPTAGRRIYRIIMQQDKESLQNLKEELKKERPMKLSLNEFIDKIYKKYIGELK